MITETCIVLSLALIAKSDFALPPSYNIFFPTQTHYPSQLDKRDSIFNTGGYFSSSLFPTESNNAGFDFGDSFGNNPWSPSTPPALQPNGACGTVPPGCPKNRYRSYDGTCNNLRNPILGTSNTPYNRLLAPKYSDGISQPTASLSGKPLPNSRAVSLTLYPDVPIQDPLWTLAAMQYGQIMTHDMSMLAGGTQTKPHSISCCSENGQLQEQSTKANSLCYPLLVPDNDPVFAKTNQRCMNFVRTLTNRDRGCVGGYMPAEQLRSVVIDAPYLNLIFEFLNSKIECAETDIGLRALNYAVEELLKHKVELTSVNHFLDLSIVYGNDDATNRQLREFQGGRLRVEVRGGSEWPPSSQNKTRDCAVQSENEPCYFAGDVRVNQNPQLTVIQVLLLREHNRVANALSHLNPHWNDEMIFQEARKIVIAEHQHISYYEWLEIFIGEKNAIKNKILYKTKDFVNDYNENVDPTVLNEHATAAFRFFHSLIAGRLHLVQEHRYSFDSLRLSDWFNRPLVLEQGDNFDDLTRGLGSQHELNSDRFHDSEITQYLFRGNRPVGSDLKAIDIQRNRDHGLNSYNEYRHFCGLRKAHSFQDFLDLIAPENVEKLAELYESPDDVDLTVGASLEKLAPGSLAGPTFLCILTEQFYRTRVGDRFFFENGNPETGFTLEQLNEIRKTSISRIFCDNAHHVQSMQPSGFEVISEHNPLVPCDQLPAVDLSQWKDLAVPSEDQFHWKK